MVSIRLCCDLLICLQQHCRFFISLEQAFVTALVAAPHVRIGRMIADPTAPAADGPIVFFDGVCHFCDASVRFVIDRDPKRVFRFAPLQSGFAQKKLGEYNLDPAELSTLVLLQNQRAHIRSEAALRIASQLQRPWSWLRFLLWIPKPLRDWFYRLIASHRYQWFGKKQSCELPKTEDQSRFLF